MIRVSEASIRHWWLPLFISLAGTFQIVSGGELSCFRLYPNCCYVNGQPYQRTAGIKDGLDCVLKCQVDSVRCMSANFDLRTRVCSLYETRNGDNGTRAVFTWGCDYYEQSKLCRRVPGGPSNPTVNPGQPTPVPSAPAPSPPAPSGPPQPPSGGSGRTNCNPGETEYFIAIPQRELDITSIGDFPVGSPIACRDACSKNQLPNGTPVACQSAVFNSGAGSCTIYSANSQTAQLINSQDAFYLERLCLSKAADPNCSGDKGFLAIPDQMINGNDLNLVQSSSFSDCLQICLGQRPNCKAAQFYPANKRCDLKTSNNVQQLVPISGGSKGYFLDTSCPSQGNVQEAIVSNFEANLKALDESLDEDGTLPWSNWSECTQENELWVQYRTRRCRLRQTCVDTRSCKPR